MSTRQARPRRGPAPDAVALRLAAVQRDVPARLEARQVVGLSIAAALAATFGAAGFISGYYDAEVWCLVGVCVAAVLVAALFLRIGAINAYAATALAGAFGLAAWAALSLTWAQSTDRAWTEANRAGVYALVLALALLVSRHRPAARLIHAVLAVLAAAFSVSIAVRLLTSGAPNLFLTGRLNSPVGYINGEAGYLLMGFWLLAAYAEPRGRPVLRGAALAAATLCAELCVLTQARAVIPAAIAAVVIALAVLPGRVTRALMLLLVSGATAACLSPLLHVYSVNTADLNAPASASAIHAAAIPAIVAALVAGALWAAANALRLRRDLGPLRRPAGRALVALLAAAVLAGLIWGHPASRASRAYDQFRAVQINQNAPDRFTDASGFRYDLWRVAIKEWRSAPLLGLGAGNYDTRYYQLRRNTDYVRQPHSIEFQLLAELGLPGLLLFAVTVGAIAAAVLRSRRMVDSPGEHMLLVAAAGAMTVWLVHTSGDWLYNLPGITGIALLLAGTVLARPHARPRPAGRFGSAPRITPRTVLTALALVAIALIAASLGREYVATRYLNAANSASSPQRAIDDSNHALALAPDSMEAQYAKAAAQAQLDMYVPARATLSAAAAKEPSNPVPYVLLGDLAQRRGLRAVAAANYAHALKLAPGDRQITQSLGAVAQTK